MLLKKNKALTWFSVSIWPWAWTPREYVHCSTTSLSLSPYDTSSSNVVSTGVVIFGVLFAIEFSVCVHQKRRRRRRRDNTSSSVLANILAWACLIVLWGVCLCYIIVSKLTKVYTIDNWHSFAQECLPLAYQNVNTCHLPLICSTIIFSLAN